MTAFSCSMYGAISLAFDTVATRWKSDVPSKRDNPSCRGILPDGEDFLLADDGKLLQKKLEGAHHSTFFLVMPKAMLTKHTA